MTRFVPLTHRDGTSLAIDAHAVTNIVGMSDGLVRVWTGEDSYEIPGTVAELAALLSDPPAGAVRFLRLGDHFINPALVASVCDFNGGACGLLIHGREAEIFVAGAAADVAAKLEGRAS